MSDATVTLGKKVKRVFVAYGQLRAWCFYSLCTAAASAVIAGIVFGIVSWNIQVQRTNCAKFERSSGYDTDFAYYGFWKQECFVNLPDGTRVPTGKLIVNVGN